MTKFTKGFIFGTFVGMAVMLFFVCALGWWYDNNHPVTEEIIVVDSIPQDTAVYLGSFGNSTRIRK